MHNSISVTDIQSGMWCQSQLEYRYLYPHMKKTQQWEKQAKEGKEVQKKTPVMIKGSDIHVKKGNNIFVCEICDGIGCLILNSALNNAVLDADLFSSA